jgi:hypothetical protein
LKAIKENFLAQTIKLLVLVISEWNEKAVSNNGRKNLECGDEEEMPLLSQLMEDIKSFNGCICQTRSGILLSVYE